MNLEEVRSNYTKMTLDEQHVNAEPFEQFKKWLGEALEAQVLEPTAMTLSTVGGDGRPSARVVLLKEVTEEGFVFYTNYQSRKAREIEKNPHVSLLFLWKELQRQVRIEGVVKTTTRIDSEQYFQSRPRGSQISAWSSAQSSTVVNRQYLESQRSSIEGKFKDVDPLPLPEFWGGYILIPEYLEFWQGREDRLHDRVAYLKSGTDWKLRRLAP